MSDLDYTGKRVDVSTARGVASVLAWLASPASSFVSGQDLNIDAGLQAAMTTGQLDLSGLG